MPTVPQALGLVATVLTGTYIATRARRARASEAAVNRPRPAVDPAGPPPVPPANHGKEIARGSASKAKIAALLEEIDAYMADQGVNVDWFPARELTLLRKGNVCSIPPRGLWPGMAYTILNVAQPLREMIGKPFWVGGYRPNDYNAEAGGAEKSRHIWWTALDIKVKDGTQNDRMALALGASQIYLEEAPRLRMGLGVYSPYPKPVTVHVDTGYKQRTWKYTQQYLDVLEVVATQAPSLAV
jgi:hypothetical protein